MYTFIINPNARSGLGLQIWKQLEQLLKQLNVEYEAFLTSHRKHAWLYTKQLTEDNAEHTIIVLGGDGTVNEVLNGIHDFRLITFGYIPIGSSNDFARGLALPKDPMETLKQILTRPSIEEIDIGVLRYPGHERRFAVSTGIGFDAAVCHEAMVSRIKVFLNRLGLGRLTYAGIALHRILFDSPLTITLHLDQKDTITFDRAYFAVAMNLPYEGGGFQFCPQANCQDTCLDILVIANMSKLKILALLPTAFKGWHTRFKGVYTYRCHEAVIETSRTLPVHTDGEPVFLQKQMQASCSPTKLRMLLPHPLHS
ncbi:MAG TPA: diacylglycerol kinase [Lachnospiraceae bacterium]|nr:diacylglycerol kinase [Lachnospiraceae bacterium]